MKIALVTSSFVSSRGGSERHLRGLARGLVRRGAEVELLTQGFGGRPAHLVEEEGVIVRVFPSVVGPVRFSIAPGLWEQLRLAAPSFDLADVHGADARLALAVIRDGFRRCVFTPHVPIGRLVSWPHARATAAVVAQATAIVCNSTFERDALCERFPEASGRTSVAPVGVDVAAIAGASPFPNAANVVLAVGRLERAKRIDRAIAAMASVDLGLRLVVVGAGPLRRRLQAHAADLRLSSCVQFVGPVPDDELYRWLRSARVVMALHEECSSGIHVTEALAAGASVVASELPVHREAAARFERADVKFVSPHGSPFEVADAITDLARRGPRPVTSAVGRVSTSHDAVADRLWDLYQRLIDETNTTTQLPRTRVA